MPYVQLDGNGAVNGLYENAQPGIAEEWREEDDPAVIAFRNPPPSADQLRKAAVAADVSYIDLFNRAKTATPAQIDTWLTANVTSLAQARVVLGALIKIVAVKLT